MLALESPAMERPTFAASLAVTRRKQLERYLHELAHEVDEARRGEELQRYFEAMAHFWRYSPTNQCFIRWQLPGATRVASRRTWEKLGRRVLPESKPIEIIAPRGKWFTVVPVFDVSQTDGAPLPDVEVLVSGETTLMPVLERAAALLGIRVTELLAPGMAVGQSLGGEIQLRAGLPTNERAATLVHELAHELLHHKVQLTETLRETEAEATAYVVLRALGLPTKSPTYIGWRGGTGATVLASARRIAGAAKEILRAVQRARKSRRAAKDRDERE